MYATLLSLILTCSVVLNAAPHPTAGSSLINNPNSSVALQSFGFSTDHFPKDWTYTKILKGQTAILELGKSNQTFLTFKEEPFDAQRSLEQYVRQYLRDYNQYGFEISGLQSQPKSLKPVVIVDLNQKNKASRSRQVFFAKKNSVLIATCSDDTEHFSETISICNTILSSIRWN